jgi:stage V sporulation protein R
VLGHSDFFANNAYFARTSRRMVDTVALNAERIRRYEFEHGTDEVERLLDAVLSIQEHVDPYASLTDEREESPIPARVGAYDDLFDRETRAAEAAAPTVAPPRSRNGLTPSDPTRDLLLFIMNHSPLLDAWERDVVAIVRAEMLYFYPQMQTKIVNEGWASFWHAQIMRELELTEDDYVEFAQLHSGILQPSTRTLNPYHLGFRILEDIERRWDADGGQGRAKLFEVRETECDVSLIRNYLTEELVNDLDLYVYERVGDELVVTDKSWESVRDRLVTRLSTHGIPVILAVDGDYNGNLELYLRHSWDGQPLDLNYAQKTLEHVHRLWGRRVWIETRKSDDERLLMSYDDKAGHQTHA